MNVTGSQELREFLDGWKIDPQNAKAAFTAYMDFVAAHSGMSFTFKARPGVSYSLRARHAAQTKRELFVLLDVVDDEPDNRWLSVCFYNNMVTDAEDKGDFVPDGLMDEDARCFNLENDDAHMRDYIMARLAEGSAGAAVESGLVDAARGHAWAQARMVVLSDADSGPLGQRLDSVWRLREVAA